MENYSKQHWCYNYGGYIMANGRLLIGKPSGGVTTVTSVDGASNTTLVLPESGVLATEQYVDSATGSALPSGFIGMWSGSIASIPTSWALCDGTNGTPNLINRFVIGSSIDVSDVSNTSVTGANTKSGGSKDAIVVAHNHTGSTNSTGVHTHSLSVYKTGVESGTSGSGSSGQPNGAATTSSAGAHSHTVTIDSTGSSGANANLPPYYALAFIMKL